MKRAVVVLVAMAATAGVLYRPIHGEAKIPRHIRRVMRLFYGAMPEACPLGRPEPPTVCRVQSTIKTPWRGC